MPVLSGGQLVGIVSEADLLPLELAPDPRAHLALLPEPAADLPRTAAEAMTQEVVALPADADIAEAARLMLERRIKSIPIVQDRQVVGIIARRDLLEILARDDQEIATALEALLADELGPPSPYRVMVRDGMVQLIGSTDPTNRQLAGRLAHGVPGVLEVRFNGE